VGARKSRSLPGKQNRDAKGARSRKALCRDDNVTAMAKATAKPTAKEKAEATPTATATATATAKAHSRGARTCRTYGAWGWGMSNEAGASIFLRGGRVGI
jgi:hypothetical protein